MPAPRLPDDWTAARADLDQLEAAREPHAAAAAYVARWPQHPPDYFADRRRDHARRAFDSGDGWACRLLSSLETVAHFTLHSAHLSLDRDAAAPHLLFDRANVRRWREAILSAFKGPCRWRLELGRAGRVHAHVLADASELPELPRGGRVVSPCEHYFEAAVRYVLKPPLEYSAEHLSLWLEAKKRGRLPNLAGSRGIPQRRTWNEPSRLRVYFAKPPPETTPTPASAPLSQHRAPSTSPRPSQPSKPFQRTHHGEARAVHNPRNTSMSPSQARARAPPDQLATRNPFDLYRTETTVITDDLSTYLDDQLDALDALTADLDDDHPDVRAARRLTRLCRDNPRLKTAPLTVRHTLFDARAVSTRLRHLHTQGDPQ